MLYVGRLTILYSILLSIELYGETIQNYSTIWICKPLLMPLLLILFLLNSVQNLFIERICLSIALILSCIGDILFIENRKDFFLYGVLVFLIVHICYIISFIIQIKHERKFLKKHFSLLSLILTSIPFLIYLLYFLSILYPKLTDKSQQTEDLLFPVIIYGTVIVGMGYISFLRGRKMPGFWSIFLGALLFIISDSLLAFNQFVSRIPIPGLPIMFTYGVGQYLITIGTLQVAPKYHKTA